MYDYGILLGFLQYKKMSLTSILKEMDRVNQRHREIQKRYNRKSRGCPRQEDLEREQLQDQRIYGYSHSEILQMFKQNKCENTEETRPCTAVESRPFTTGAISRKVKNEPQMRRAQSAVKIASYKQQYNFLFKQDIFDENYEKARYSSPFINDIAKQNERKMSKMLVNRSIPKTVKKMHSQSIRAQRINFIKSFDENLNRIQNKNRKKLIKQNKNYVFYSKKECPEATATPNTENEDFFKLTKAPQEKQPQKKMKILLSNSFDNLREQEAIINTSDSEKCIQFDRQSSFGRYLPLMQTNFIDLLPNRFILTCIIMENLQSVRFKLMLKNGSIVLEDSKEILNLSYIFSQLIASNSLVHLIFHTENKELIYEEILVNQAFKNLQNKEHEIILLMYYLKRFLMFDRLSTFKSVQQSADLLLKSNIDLPDDFIDFVETFQGKICRIYDKDQRLYQFNLKTALSNALSSIIAFKQEMGFGKKVVKLKHGTREEFKKYLYNWEYFYICFFL